MQNESSSLPRVRFTVPIPGMTFEEYLQYLSWRIEIQVLAMLLVDKAIPRSKVIDQLVSVNRRAARFPVQPLPDNTVSREIILDLIENKAPIVLKDIWDGKSDWKIYYAVFARRGFTQATKNEMKKAGGLCVDLKQIDIVLGKAEP